MRLALVVALIILAATGWQHRGDLHLPVLHHHHRIAYGDVSTAKAAAGWLVTSSGEGVRRARCVVSSARPPAPPIPSFAGPGQVEIGTYSCRGKAARRRSHAWCVIALRYQSPSSPPVLVWNAAAATCGTLSRQNAQRSG
jgi:hypothetical protein